MRWTVGDDEFWSVLEGLARGDAASMLALREILEAMPLDQVAEFDARLHRAMDRAHVVGVWAAAYVMCGGCSDDGFDAFKAWLVLQGREIYEAALARPDSLSSVSVEYPACEELGGMAASVYEARSGRQLAGPRFSRPDFGEEWDFGSEAEMRSRLPELWRRYGHDPL